MIFQWRKWDGSTHWRHECVYLGSDEWGDWLGQPAGWRSDRPGKSLTVTGSSVTLVPAMQDGVGFAHSGVTSPDFAVTVNRNHPKGMRIYIDLGWDIQWSADGSRATGIDMDLDVVRVDGPSGTWVDDRDEWAEHSAAFGYPAEVMEQLEALALDLEDRVRAQRAPFDDATADRWLDALEALRLER